MKKTTNALKNFRKRWEKVRKIEEKELQNLSMAKKICQLTSLMRIGMGLGMDFRENKKKNKVRSRWVFLKRNIT